MAGLVNPFVVSFNSGGTLVKEVVYPYPCTVHAVHVGHTTGSSTYIQIHDLASAPADGAVPQQSHSVASGQDAHIEHSVPVYYANGVYICESSTLPTKTLAAVAHLFVHILIEASTP